MDFQRIIDCDGSIFDSSAQALVNPVNCVGVMGKGLAAEFKRRWPLMFKAYKYECDVGQLQPGSVHVWSDCGAEKGTRFVVNFPTKGHWRTKSNMDDIRNGLVQLDFAIEDYGITHIAIPAIGCGEGGLRWADVRERIVAAFSSPRLQHVTVELYAPR
jgi:O-acetyl-ADP-ribose deacetylase (regulator of RNase III)